MAEVQKVDSARVEFCLVEEQVVGFGMVCLFGVNEDFLLVGGREFFLEISCCFGEEFFDFLM